MSFLEGHTNPTSVKYQQTESGKARSHLTRISEESRDGVRDIRAPFAEFESGLLKLTKRSAELPSAYQVTKLSIVGAAEE